MHSEFRGECNYHAESNVHFPHLRVDQTLVTAAGARVGVSATRPSRKRYVKDATIAIAAALRLSHTMHTKVGNEFVRGISGGERQRAGIAEVLVWYISSMLGQ